MGSSQETAGFVFGSSDAIIVAFNTVLGYIGHVLATALTTIFSVFG